MLCTWRQHISIPCCECGANISVIRAVYCLPSQDHRLITYSPYFAVRLVTPHAIISKRTANNLCIWLQNNNNTFISEYYFVSEYSSQLSMIAQSFWCVAAHLPNATKPGYVLMPHKLSILCDLRSDCVHYLNDLLRRFSAPHRNAIIEIDSCLCIITVALHRIGEPRFAFISVHGDWKWTGVGLST